MVSLSSRGRLLKARLVRIFVIVCLLYIPLSACGPRSAERERVREVSNVQLFDATLILSANGQKLIEAHAKNTSQHTLKGITVEFSVFDETGLEFGSLAGHIVELRSGDTYDLALPVSANTNGFRLRRILTDE